MEWRSGVNDNTPTERETCHDVIDKWSRSCVYTLVQKTYFPKELFD